MTPKTKKRIWTLLSALLVLLNTTYGQNFYENKQFVGIKILRPQNWILAANADLENNLGKLKFNNEELQKLLNSNKGIITLCTYYKYRIDSVSGLIPTVKVTIRKNLTSNFSDFKQAMIESTNKVKTVVKNFEFIEHFKEAEISGYSCLSYSCRYSLTLANGDNMNVRSKYYMIPKGKYFISISLMDNENNEDCSQVFDQLTNSLQLTK